jgi:primary-amine oxidase
MATACAGTGQPGDAAHAGHAQPVDWSMQPAAPPDGDSAIMIERRRLFAEQQRRREAHQRAARARPPPRRPASTPPGIVQIPIDLSRRSPLAKPERPTPTAATARPAARTERAAPVSRRPLRAAAQPPPPACPNRLPYPGNMPPMRTASIVKTFPDIAWHICVTDMGAKGLWVGPVELLRDPSDGWRTILYQAGPADIFVPYHNNPAARYYDLNAYAPLMPISVQDVGPGGAPLWLSNETFPTVAYEVRQRGVGWLCKGNITEGVRRSQELVLWAVSDAGNYDNIIEYGFRDDGSISFRTGNTGYNSIGSPFEPHSHDALWYVDIDFNGFPNDTASMLTHAEPTTTSNPLLALDQRVPIAVEGARVWQPYFQLVSLLVEDVATQFHWQPWGYEFSPLQSVATRHFGWQENWSHNDIYVTRYNFADTLWASPIVGHQVPDLYLLPALNNQPTVNQDLVLWMKTAVHHTPTTEDRGASQWMGNLDGVTLTHWSGFQMQPHNLFPHNPLGAPLACGT